MQWSLPTELPIPDRTVFNCTVVFEKTGKMRAGGLASHQRFLQNVCFVPSLPLQTSHSGVPQGSILSPYCFSVHLLPQVASLGNTEFIFTVAAMILRYISQPGLVPGGSSHLRRQNEIVGVRQLSPAEWSLCKVSVIYWLSFNPQLQTRPLFYSLISTELST